MFYLFCLQESHNVNKYFASNKITNFVLVLNNNQKIKQLFQV